MSKFSLLRFGVLTACLTGLLACAQAPVSPVNPDTPSGTPTTQSLIVTDDQPFLTQLSASEQSALKSKYASCLNTANPFLAGLDSPQITECQFLMQPTSQLSSSTTPFAEDALRLDRSFLTERALSLSYQAGDQVKQIRTYAELKSLYAPIENPAEALSFVLLKTYNSQILNQDNLKRVSEGLSAGAGVDWLQTRTTGTQVSKTPEGNYLVRHLLIAGMCSASSNSYQISPAGDVQNLEAIPLYRLKTCPVE